MALAVAVAAALLTGLHLAATRGRNLGAPVHWALVAVVIALAGFSMFEIHTIGESGARAAWGSALDASPGN